MGTLDFKKERYHLHKITDSLKRRGYKPVFDEDWEIHGPHHPELPYQVYVGYAEDTQFLGGSCCVAIYPRAVYTIEDPSCWGSQAVPENKVPTIQSLLTPLERSHNER